MRKHVMTNKPLIDAIEKATGCLPNTVLRVVIDIKADEFPKVYIEQFGDPEGLLAVIEAMTDIQIVKEESQ